MGEYLLDKIVSNSNSNPRILAMQPSSSFRTFAEIPTLIWLNTAIDKSNATVKQVNHLRKATQSLARRTKTNTAATSIRDAAICEVSPLTKLPRRFAMKPRTFAAILVLGLAACLTSAQAQVIPLPCTVLLCMAGTTSGLGTSAADPACTVPIAYWYLPDGTGLAVYDPYFDPVDSYNVRLAFLQTCIPGAAANPVVIAAIMSQHGSAPSP